MGSPPHVGGPRLRGRDASPARTSSGDRKGKPGHGRRILDRGPLAGCTPGKIGKALEAASPRPSSRLRNLTLNCARGEARAKSPRLTRVWLRTDSTGGPHAWALDRGASEMTQALRWDVERPWFCRARKMRDDGYRSGPSGALLAYGHPLSEERR
jgi:hypothetical protein